MEKRRLSLKSGLYILVAVCWILPLLATVFWFALRQESSSRSWVEDSVITSVEHAKNETARRFSDVLVAARAVNYDGDIARLYTQYLEDEDFTTMHHSSQAYLQSQYGYNEAFGGVALFYWDHTNQPVLVSGQGIQGQSYLFREFRTMVENGMLAQAKDLGTKTGVVRQNGTAYVVRNLVDHRFEGYATLVLPIQTGYLEESCANVLWIKSGALTIDNVVLPICGDEIENYGEMAYQADQGQFVLGTQTQVDGHTLRLDVAVEDDFLHNERMGFYLAIAVVVVLSGLLFAVVVFYFSRNIAVPMGRLLHATRHLEKGDLGYHISKFSANLEFYQLTVRFNHLSDKLVEQFERHTLEQQALHDAQIKALQSQINPHFLNNTLEMINWQARMSGEDKISQMIESLSVMLNAAMARGGNAMVTMKEEFSYIEAYLYIISHRFGSRLTVSQDIEEKTWSAMVPRLILQPIVENAIEHGVAQRTSGEIHLHIYTIGDMLYLDVTHQGSISPTDRETIDRLLSWDGQENTETGSARIGIRNVHLRLKILCGEGSGLQIWEDEAGHVCNRITLPFRPNL